MNRLALATAGITIVAAAPPEVVAIVPPAPPAPPLYGPQLVSWSAGAVRCGDAQPAVVRAPDPDPSLGYGGAAERATVITVRFRIDENGRPLGIERAGSDFTPNAEDVLPAMAAARFAPGTAQAACSVQFTAVREPLATAAVATAWRYSLMPNGTPPGELWRRVWAGENSCTNPAPEPLLRAFPDYKRLPGTPGARQWAMLRYDIDRRGRPVAAKVAGGTGDAALDAAALTAMAGSRFEAGARTGCLMPFVRGAATLMPPEPLSEDAVRPAGATCPREVAYVRPPTLTYPEAYRKRAIEGWAVLAYDVAPWGAIGNVRVLAAEPTAEFGEAAKRVMASATKPPSNTGYVGCVDRVLFKLNERVPPAVVETITVND